MTEWVSDCCGAELETLDGGPIRTVDMRCAKCSGVCRRRRRSIEVKEWDEIRVQGLPNPAQYGSSYVAFPPYDFTFRSDREYEGKPMMGEFEKIKKHLPKWTDVQISKRHVRQEITEWEPITKEELEK